MARKILNILFQIAYLFIELIFALLIFLFVYLAVVVLPRHPEIDDLSALDEKRIEVGADQYRIGNNWSRKNDHGIWEVYVEGAPFDRGVYYGKLLEDQVKIQEKHFVGQIKKIVPSGFGRFWIKIMVAFFNRDLYLNVPEEYTEEIYGVSFSFADEFDSEGPKFHRILNYHAAHDIGHALQDYMIVGCTSFSLKNGLSQDSSLIVGRNFDFFVGDDFAEEKVISFISPDEGYKFASYSWAGLMGVVSGMNETGLCVTINASKSDLPTKSKTPISIVTREILQYASTIEEAISIAKKSEVFVSETIMVTSAIDNRTALIEITPNGMSTYEPLDDQVLCTNHYQSEKYWNDPINQENIANSDSKYRYDKLTTLIDTKSPVDLNDAVSILRDRSGKDGKNIGMGNPKSINQLIAHHSVIFKPKEKLMWVSTAPYQLGQFICYDLDEVFAQPESRDLSIEIYIDSLTIKKDPFVESADYENYLYFKEIKGKLTDHILIGIEYQLTEKVRDQFIKSNPKSYVTYMVLGEYYQSLDQCQDAKKYFDLALENEVSSKDEEEKIKQLKNECGE